jgi:hypothetical protein
MFMTTPKTTRTLRPVLAGPCRTSWAGIGGNGEGLVFARRRAR